MGSPGGLRGLFTFRQDLFKYLLPSGVPRSSFIILAGEGGSGKSVILAHIVKDFLSAGEPAIYVAIDDDPQTVINQLESFGVNALEECKSKRLIFIDGFSYLMQVKRPWPCVEEEITPEAPEKIVPALWRIVERYKIVDQGVLIIDSLNDIVMLLDPTRVISFIKSLRANFAKARGILSIATLHTSTESFRNYLLTIEHIVDGILETSSVPGELAQQLPIFVRAISVRKMKGVESRPGPTLYGIDHEGLKPVVLRITRGSK